MRASYGEASPDGRAPTRTPVMAADDEVSLNT